MPNNDIQPPREHEPIDEEIREAEEEVRHFRRWRNIVLGAISGWIVVEVCLILIAVITQYKNWDVAPWVGGLGFPVFGGMIIAAAYDISEKPYTRSGLMAAENKLERLKSQKREQGIGRSKGKAALYQRYKESMPELIERYRIVANHYRNIYNALQAFIIVGSLTASTFIGAFEPAKWARWSAVVLASSVGIASAIGAHFKLSERSTEMQKAADLIEIEFRAAEFGIGGYEDLEPEGSLRRFVENVERIRTEHMTKKRQLDQPPDIRFVDSSSIN